MYGFLNRIFNINFFKDASYIIGWIYYCYVLRNLFSNSLYLEVQNSQKRFPVEVIQTEENVIKFRLKIYSSKNIYIHNFNFFTEINV